MVYAKWLEQIRTAGSCGLLDVIKLPVCRSSVFQCYFSTCLIYIINLGQHSGASKVLMTPFVRFLSEHKKGKYSRKKSSAPTTLAVFAFEKKTAMKEHSVTTSGVICSCMAFKTNQGNVKGPISLNLEDVSKVNLPVSCFNSPCLSNHLILQRSFTHPKPSVKPSNHHLRLKSKCPAHTPKIQKKRKTRNLSLCLKNTMLDLFYCFWWRRWSPKEPFMSDSQVKKTCFNSCRSYQSDPDR